MRSANNNFSGTVTGKTAGTTLYDTNPNAPFHDTYASGAKPFGCWVEFGYTRFNTVLSMPLQYSTTCSKYQKCSPVDSKIVALRQFESHKSYGRLWVGKDAQAKRTNVETSFCEIRRGIY